jgi:uncharacterized repeat protein (TIGR03803 family)
MKNTLCKPARTDLADIIKNSIRIQFVCFLLLGLLALPLSVGARQFLPGSISNVTTNLPVLHHSSRWNRLHLSIALPLRDRVGLTNLLQQLYDPSSANYHQFLTPAQFAARFGPTGSDYESVTKFAKSHGLIVTGRHSNRALLSVEGTVADIERAFHVSINQYQDPKHSRIFYAPDTAPSLDLDVPVLAVSGLDNYFLPHPCLRPIPAEQTKPNLTGSGPNGGYLGNDFRAAYIPGSPVTGTGQTVGLLEFDSGYYQSDITAYETLAGLPNVPVSAVLLDGYNGAAGGGNDEVSLDIEMAVSMAPGLKQVLVYEGSTTDDILNRMATDDVAKQIGASWTYPTDAGSDQAFLQFAAQGQSFFNASGDSDAYTGTIPTPADDPNITVVGGTTLTTTGPGGAWESETVWNWGGGTGSSGGISTVIPIPTWQQGINMTVNEGSTTRRNLPDVAMTADNVYVIYGNGHAGAFGGTSCATPLWAGFTALVNQAALTNGEPTIGLINPVVYGMGKGSNALGYTQLFHDITTGNNESSQSPTRFSAVAGYDLCTGWGTPQGSSLLNALAIPEPLRIAPGGSVIFTGPVGGPFTPATQNFSLTNNGVGELNWSLLNTSSWFNVTPPGGTLGTMAVGGFTSTVTVRVVPAVTNLPAGGYSATLLFSNLTDKFAQARVATLAIVTPPVITSQPANQALLVGMAANFNVGIANNALMFYQWQENGTNLTDGGQISGSATSTLTVSKVTLANVGSYSVNLSNAAGILVSSNAALTIVPSAPVIVQQPTNETVLPGAPASFSIVVVGNTPYSYFWQLNRTKVSNGANVAGANTGILTINSAQPVNVGNYIVTISNSLGSVTSTGAILSTVVVTAPGVTMSTLSSFGSGNSGQLIYSPLTQARDGNFYGTTIEGGTSGEGTVFRVTTNGSQTTPYSFNGNLGAIPYGGLDLGKDGYLYGTAFTGGNYGDGSLFRITTGGSFQLLTTLNGNNGMFPTAGLVQGSDGNFYGTTLEGGAYGYGTVFRMTTGGLVTTLVSFNFTDGGDPSPVLVEGSDGNFYGTTEEGGTNGIGTIFRMTPSGLLTSLYSFTGNSDGAIPIAGLVQGVDGNFYGTAYEGGASFAGTVFKVTPAGEFTTLYAFTGGSDGAYPWGGLFQAADGNLYGTAQSGGTYGFGTVFQMAPAGPLNPLVQFEGYNGSSPSAALIQGTDGNLYGTTQTGGSAGDGTVFEINLSGPLQITGQPSDQSAYLGGSAAFTVATSGSGPVSYQWQQDGVNLTDGGTISGSSTATLQISNVVFNDAALYSVIVGNAFNSVTSDYAVLDVSFSPPAITTQPASLTRVVGTAATFSVTAAGDQPLTYQWQMNGINLTNAGNISGATSSTLTFSSVTMSNIGNYSVVVSNSLFSVSSKLAGLSVVTINSPSAALTSLRLFNGTGSGTFPYGGLIQGKDGYLYGTTAGGGPSYDGTIFRATLTGGITPLYPFNNGSAGGIPRDSLLQGTNGNFYATTTEGGADGYGAIFKMSPTALVTPLYSFTGGSDGANPPAGLVQGPDGNFYGTAYQGGAYSYGCVYRMTSLGAVTPIYAFTGASDGAYPYAGLFLGRDGSFNGTTVQGGAQGDGTVFRITTNGTLTTLASFSNVNGGYPQAGVIQGLDGNLYGTTLNGGTNGFGTIFSLTTNGLLTTLCSFANTNGRSPAAALVQGTDGNLYGTTSAGGAGGQGTAFMVTTNGTLTTLLWFDGLDGASPQSAMVQASDGNFYGTTTFGGVGFNPSAGGGNGTVFCLTVPVFINRTFSVSSAISSLPYSATMTGKSVAPAGDQLQFAKVAGPAWLNVSTNGLLSGTPANANIGTNIFLVSLTDTNGVSATASMSILVIADPPPTFVTSPFAEPWANLDEDYSGTIATNATTLYLAQGDALSFAIVSGPAWLSLAADGTFSGVPQGVDAGTNIFVVSVTNLGGSSNATFMTIYVNSPPVFSPQTFSKQAATVGVPYYGTIATNTTDPDLIAGDSLSFYKVTGPAWLDVATNGVLSGTPSGTDRGANSFLLLVVDSGGLSGIGFMNLQVNADNPPVFAGNPFTEPPILAGQIYSATIATNASEPILGDVITFSKISGPGWLSVAGNGNLSGMPLTANAGINAFVVSVTDLGGLSTSATMYVSVTAIPIYETIINQGTNSLLTWSGGVPPYQVLTTTNPINPVWQVLGSPTTSTNAVVSPTNTCLFYLIQGQ